MTLASLDHLLKFYPSFKPLSVCVRKVLGQGGLGGEVEGKVGRKGTLRENHGEHLENLTPASGIWKV